MSKSDDHPDGPWQVPDRPSLPDDRPRSPGGGGGGDGAAMDGGGLQNAAAASADVDVPQLWSSVRGRLLITAVSVSMMASVVVLIAWICLRSVSS